MSWFGNRRSGAAASGQGTRRGGKVDVMRTQSPDTSPEAERVLIELLRQAPAWRKLRMVEDTNRSVKDLLMTGLRQRFPHDSPGALRRRLADLWLGPELSAVAYGPLPEAGGFTA